MRRFVTLSYRPLALLAAVAELPGAPTPAAGEQVFTGNKCNDCHYTQGPATERRSPISWPRRAPSCGTRAASSRQAWLRVLAAGSEPIRPLKPTTP